MRKYKILACNAINLLLVVSFLVLSASATSTETFTVTQNTYQITFNLPAGAKFNGSISTTNTIRVLVNDANGTILANPGLVDSHADFGFVAAKAGDYYIIFENPLSAIAQVTFTYQTDPELSNSNSLIPLSLWPVFVIIAAIGCVLIIYLSRRNRKHAKNTISA
jgi:hypothetical protein